MTQMIFNASVVLFLLYGIGFSVNTILKNIKLHRSSKAAEDKRFHDYFIILCVVLIVLNAFALFGFFAMQM